MISGFRPVADEEMMRASGVRPRAFALVSLITTTAAAPSFRGQALPAVTVPSGRNTGPSPLSFSTVVPARMPSSVLATPSGVVTGVISASQKPLFRLSSARFWLRAANSSWSARDTFSSCATFSAV